MMYGKQRVYGVVLGLLMSLPLGLAAQARAEVGVSMSGMGVVFQAPVAMIGYAVQLSVNGPGDWTSVNSYQPGETILLSAEQGFEDGQYRYELSARTAEAALEKSAEEEGEYAREESGEADADGRVVNSMSRLASTAAVMPETVSGTFRMVGGTLFIPDAKESEETERVSGSSSLSAFTSGIGATGEDRSSDGVQTRDVIHADDVIIQSSLCVGFDCVNGESFGFDTFRLKENNLRVHFQDTSATGSFPSRDWRIVINDSSNGGANYFAVQDSDSSRNVFLVEAGAPANSLYVEDYGRVGLGTSTPVVELHIKDSDTPTVRLEQDGSGGWTPQTWDLAGNESNFFIRDATNGSKLPFRIQPGTPSSTLCLKNNGYVGVGTWSPEAMLHVVGGVYVQGDIETPIPNELQGVMHVDGDAYINGNLELASSRELKDHIATLDGKEAVACLKDLTPVSFEYKRSPGETQLGFIAEDVPELVASNNRKGLNPMDIAAVLTRVVQEQQSVMGEQQALLGEQRRQNEIQQAQIEALQNRLAELEARLAK